jgi:hypothetical protein
MAVKKKTVRKKTVRPVPPLSATNPVFKKALDTRDRSATVATKADEASSSQG